MFPVARKSTMRIFEYSNTKPINNNRLEAAINQLNVQSGKCYINSDTVRTIGGFLNIPIKYYSGWFFLPGDIPIYHEWNELDGQIIDVSTSIAEYHFLSEKFRNLKTSNPNWRNEVAKSLVAFRKRRRQISKDCVWGNVLEGFLYVGCEDTHENAKDLVGNLAKGFPEHLSFAHKQNARGSSELNRIIWKQQSR